MRSRRDHVLDAVASILVLAAWGSAVAFFIEATGEAFGHLAACAAGVALITFTLFIAEEWRRG